jgi:hypothetical protein
MPVRRISRCRVTSRSEVLSGQSKCWPKRASLLLTGLRLRVAANFKRCTGTRARLMHCGRAWVRGDRLVREQV